MNIKFWCSLSSRCFFVHGKLITTYSISLHALCPLYDVLYPHSNINLNVSLGNGSEDVLQQFFDFYTSLNMFGFFSWYRFWKFCFKRWLDSDGHNSVSLRILLKRSVSTKKNDEKNIVFFYSYLKGTDLAFCGVFGGLFLSATSEKR